jgi:PAS domain S-box-containing protein
MGTIADISVRKQAVVQLFEEKENSPGHARVDRRRRHHRRRRRTCRVHLNPVAEQLTGWASAEAGGRPVGEVIHLVAESSRLPVENPIVRCLREGRMVEMDEQSLLINRSGIEISIQDSAAPIRDRGGRLVGVW